MAPADILPHRYDAQARPALPCVAGHTRRPISPLQRKIAEHNSACKCTRSPDKQAMLWYMPFPVTLVPAPAGHEAGEEHVEVYREQLGPDGKTLVYRLPAEGGATPGTPAALDGKPILEPYAGLEVSPAYIQNCSHAAGWVVATSAPVVACAQARYQNHLPGEADPFVTCAFTLSCSPCSRSGWQLAATTPPTAMTSPACLTMRCVAFGQHAQLLGSHSLCHHLASWWRHTSLCWQVQCVCCFMLCPSLSAPEPKSACMHERYAAHSNPALCWTCLQAWLPLTLLYVVRARR